MNKMKYIKGTAKQIDNGKGKKIINLSINVRQLEEIMNEEGYANIAIFELNETDKYGNTHFIVKRG